jgi:hypothetical protein
LVVLAALDGFSQFQFWMVGLVACLYAPLLFIAWQATLAHDALEIRYVLRRRIVPVECVTSIELTDGFPHALKVRFSRGMRLKMNAGSAALQLAMALVRLNGRIEAVGFEEAFDY